MRYDTIRYIYVHSEADAIASLIYRTVQKRKNKEKLKTKKRVGLAQKKQPGTSPWRQSGRKKWNFRGGVGFEKTCRFQTGSERERWIVMDEQSGESKE